MSNYLMLNGKKIELTEEQVKILTEEPKNDVFRKPKEQERYWFIDTDGEVRQALWEDNVWNELHYKNGNCCFEREPLERERLDIILYQRLKRFSCMNGWNESVWDDSTEEKWYLWHTAGCGEWFVSWSLSTKHPMQVYFMTRELVEQAIEEVVKPFCKEFPEYLKEVSE